MTAPRYDIPEEISLAMKSSGVKVAGHREIDYATKYTLTRDTNSAELNVFHTGKTSVGGKDSSLKRHLEAWRLKTGKSKVRKPGKNVKRSTKAIANSTPRIGTDEAGKGEYIGPLVVAGVRVLGASQDQALRAAGVRDSKDLENTRVRSLSRQVIEIVGAENSCILALEPPEYERRRDAAGRNVNRLLGELNTEIIDKLKDEVEAIVVDSFGTKAHSYIEPYVPEGISLDVRPRAEDDMAVAAASILARTRYLQAMDRLSEEVGFELPRGSTHVEEAARRVVDELGEEGLKRIAKTHFSITAKVLAGKPRTE
ncbi:hypothetical protein BH23ACT11_BH23ACT11_26990 [soil metagenome]